MVTNNREASMALIKRKYGKDLDKEKKVTELELKNMYCNCKD
jgi:hypothetical protein